MEELLDADFGDFRLSDRVIQLVEKLSQRPAAARAACDFCNNAAVSPQMILAAHVQQTARRASEYPVALVARDTTEINLTSHRKTTGLGYLGSTGRRGLMMHNLLAISPQAALPDHPHQVVVADRESDLYDLFAMPPDSRTDLLVRMRDRRRRLEHPRSAPFFTRRQGPRPGETAR